MRTKACLFCSLAGLLWLLPLRAADLPAPLHQQDGPLELTIAMSPPDSQTGLSLSGSLSVTVSVAGGRHIEIKLPKTLIASPAWKTATPLLQGPITQPGWRQTFVVYPRAPGQQVLQIEPILYREGTDSWSKAVWKPIPINVTTQIAEADVKHLRDITAIEKLPPAPSLWEWLVWALPSLGVIALFWFVVRHWRQRRVGVHLAADQWAARELDRLQALNLPASGEVERFHTLLSNVVRRYVENRFEVPARRQTTPEFLHVMANGTLLQKEDLHLLAGLLERCDLAKFARARPPEEECRAAIDTARGFVQRTSPSRMAVNGQPGAAAKVSDQ